MGALRYRPEIDGLRAVAVMPVVLYHLSPAWVPGGFVGVDVFFVISGFLITSIILREVAAGEFTLRNFWMRRVRRLFPALAFLLVLVLVAGSLLLYEGEWQDLGEQVLAVLLLLANVFMAGEAGDYWGEGADRLLLLHTWSLAVEEQFYLFFPLALLGVLKWGARRVLPVLVIGGLASFGFGLWQLGGDAAAAFYLLPGRAWELLAGAGVAAWIWRGRAVPKQSWLAGAGVVLIVASYLVIRDGENFPGWKAVLPVTGAGLVLAGSGKSMATVILSARPLVFLGRISYSLYLWHWPVIVFWRLQTQEDVAALRHALPILLVSLAGATLSYYYVERPFRRPAFPLRSGKGFLVMGGFTGLMLVAVTVWAGRVTSLERPAFDRPPFTAQQYSAAKDEVWRRGGVVLGTVPPELVVIGSSHAIMYGATVESIAQEQGRGVAFLCMGNTFGRFAFPGDDAIHRDGIAKDRAAFDVVRMKCLEEWRPKVVLWFDRWENQYETLGPERFEKAIGESLSQILEYADRVILTTQAPFSMKRSGSIVRFATRRSAQGRPVVGEEDPERRALRLAANDLLRDMAARREQVGLVEVEDLFELDGGAVRIVTSGGRLLYHDDNHLSDWGAALAGVRLSEALR